MIALMSSWYGCVVGGYWLGTAGHPVQSRNRSSYSPVKEPGSQSWLLWSH